MHYQLWDLVSGNLLGSYTTEEEALRWVRRYLEDEGPEYVADLALDGPNDRDERVIIAQHHDLIRRCQAVPAATVFRPQSN